MKFAFAALAASLAFGSIGLPATSAQAHASNCTYFNGPYCELAHDIRHHNWRSPVTWPRQTPYYGGYDGYGEWQGDWSSYNGSYPSYGQQPYAYPPATSQWRTPGLCQIESAFGCRFRSPSYGYGYGGYTGYGGLGGY